ncbi:YciI family protein [Paenibacillus sp. yr247]|uniref:YciI family protein n=1 Tax=Paenibacillus sp. yr247 TaxID=1761880 RepID=UPI000B8959A0|nr:YciI family protein [Paenibacillus sp. yr247]
MIYFVVFLPMLSPEKSVEYRPQHLEYLAKLREEGKIFANGRFLDGAGGLVIYMAESFEQVQRFVEQDPYVIYKARGFEIHEWEIVLGDSNK